MNRPIIICDKIGKSYRLGVKRRDGGWFNIGRNLTLRESLSNSFRAALQRLKGSRPDEDRWRHKPRSALPTTRG